VSRFIVDQLPLRGLMRVERQCHGDGRGFLARMFCADELAGAGWKHPVVQINHTYTARKGTVRGMHFQHPPHAEMKQVNCLRGEIFDVAVDLRRNSPTFLHWHGEILSAENRRGLLIPEGFAHGFQTLSDDVELIYLHSCAYSPQAEAGLNAEDPAIAIRWPLDISEMSSRDRQHPRLSSDFSGIEMQ
jgi:dTDP-4-dehydrorhamnose 3,5-epimerase